jgi:ribosomal protein S18 acetylase RimI-like enzyme
MQQTEVTFEPFDSRALSTWLEESRAGYINERMASGDSPQEAEANAARAFDQLVPGGSPAPGQLIGRLLVGDHAVGHLWVGPAGNDPARWWVWEVAIFSEMRGRGLGRQAMLVAERLARSRGATAIGLNVFGHNRIARDLYTSLGYEESAVVMRKPL